MKNKYIIDGETAIVDVTSKGIHYKISVDVEDLPKIGKRTIGAFVTSWGDVYFLIYVNRVRVLLHRFIMDAPKDLQVDHRDRDTTNNRKRNLRLVTNAQNGQNRGIGSDNKSGVRGVFYRANRPKKPWWATVTKDGKKVYSKHFPTKEEAETAIIKARKELLPFSFD